MILQALLYFETVRFSDCTVETSEAYYGPRFFIFFGEIAKAILLIKGVRHALYANAVAYPAPCFTEKTKVELEPKVVLKFIFNTVYLCVVLITVHSPLNRTKSCEYAIVVVKKHLLYFGPIGFGREKARNIRLFLWGSIRDLNASYSTLNQGVQGSSP